MNKLEIFELLLQECKNSVERTVFFRISPRADAEDVLQEVYLTAYRKFETLENRSAFKAWIISIARNKCVDYYRKKAAVMEFPMEILSGRIMVYGRYGVRERGHVREALEQLSDKDQNILKLYYFQGLPQTEIARKLRIPLGTVKSRLYAARENFRKIYLSHLKTDDVLSGGDEKETQKRRGTVRAEVSETELMQEETVWHRFTGTEIKQRETQIKLTGTKRKGNKTAGIESGTTRTGQFQTTQKREQRTKETAEIKTMRPEVKAMENEMIKETIQKKETADRETKQNCKESDCCMATTKTREARKATVLPEFLPEYIITKSQEPPFETIWEELQGWMIVPRLGEQLTWGLYELPSRRRTEYTELVVAGRAQVHGIDGVEIIAMQYNAEDYYRTGSVNEMERRFVAQLTDTHSRYLAESHVENGVRKCYTFLDGDSFTKNWGFGEDNCGNEIHVRAKGILQRGGSTVTVHSHNGKCGSMDVVGRYTVNIGGKSYDTICVMDVESFDDAVVTESYIDRNGRTVLWRRFNRDDWALAHFGGKKWSEMLPDNEKLTVGGSIYVHWYDCISDYIL